MRQSPTLLFIFLFFLGGHSVAQLPVQRIDIHVDGGRPIAGERSRFASAPDGTLYFTYTLAAGDLSCKPMGIIRSNSDIELTAIDSESTWNVDGWGTYGFPFDLTVDSDNRLHAASRHRGQPYGIDYWHEVDGQWQLESFGANVTFGGNNVSLGMLPDNKPIVIGLAKNRTQLAVWERSVIGDWSVTLPEELRNVASGHFDLATRKDGSLDVVFCASNGSLNCASRSPEGDWQAEEILLVGKTRMIAATSDQSKQLHVSFAAGNTLGYAKRMADGQWHTQTLAEVDAKLHVGRTDIAVSEERVVIAWERGFGPTPTPKDYGGTTGATLLTIVGEATHEIASMNAGRPSLALSKDGSTAWIGVYTGNDHGDDFYLLKCELDGVPPDEKPVVRGTPETMFRDACLKDIASGNSKAEERGLLRINFDALTNDQQISLIERSVKHQNPVIQTSMLRGLTSSPEALTHFSDQLSDILREPNPLIRKTFLEGLLKTKNIELVKPLVETAITTPDATTQLVAAEIIREHPDWLGPEAFGAAMESLTNRLANDDQSVSGAAAMALERLSKLDRVRAFLKECSLNGNLIQRVRSALILFRAKEAIVIPALAEIPSHGSLEAQLTLCGLLGQIRSAEGVKLLRELLHSQHSQVRTAAVFALRSTAHVAKLEPVAKHPKGFDIVALRNSAPKSPEEANAQQLAIAALITSLQHRDPNIREKACDALNRVGATQALEPLAVLLNDSDAGVRIAAHSAIQVLSNDPSSALINLEKWRSDAKNRTPQRLNPVHRLPTPEREGVVEVGSDKQLLIDDFIVASSSNLSRRLHSFQKHPRNPVFQAQLPWEEGWTDPFMSTVLYDPEERCFKMWYRCGPRHSLKAYAVSSDGIHWQRPDIAESPWQEFTHHNLLGFEGEIATWKKPGNNVQFFPDAKGANRFLSLFYQPPSKDFAVSHSADGIHWEHPVSVRPAHGDVVSLIWDPGSERYLFFPKYKREKDGFVRRSFAATTLAQIKSPFTAQFPFLASHRDDGRVAVDASRAYGSLLPNTLRLSDFHSEIYSVTALPYEGMVVALYDLWPVHGSSEGPLDMPLKVSRDMKTWTDVDYPRRALSIGKFGEWDSGMVYGGNTMLVVNDEIRLYYLGANMGHCTKVLPTTKPYHALGMGLATLRLDGFTSLQASSQQTGSFTTKPMAIASSNLSINARCADRGSIRAELVTEQGEPIPGFTLEDCVPFQGDSIRHTMKWKASPAHDSPRLPTPVRLRVELSSAEMFAFQFSPD